ncbi:lipopolysaccharide biosynthesis protein [Catalinimonas niigatensis]|uniref:lipopolysaccharide biosynthesis protein n=1 Tax=Catalinimonas niigatensis TaxID=1397264 RepID=UPI0026671883|nr:lipopolysaccharide biosynthesis protein [Catalinimonas niigatensis]WPP48363.1 lipopolysaccharide biosynthesis protein [Catalinimonas niigatensis]
MIQRRSKELSELHYSTAFWANLGVSLFSFLIVVFGVAPLAAWFYEEPILRSLVPVIAISIILDAFYVMPKTKLTKKLHFKPQAIVMISSSVIAGIVSIILASQGFGVWALAYNGIIISLTSALLYTLYVSWKPKLVFDKTAFKELFGFGGFVLLQNIFNYLKNNIDYIMIGKLIGSSALGVYTLAFILTDTVRKQIMAVLDKVLFPIYSSMQDQPEVLGSYYMKVIKFNGLTLIPLMTGMVVFAREVIIVAFGPDWSEAVFPLQMLALGVVVHTASGTSTAVLHSLGHANIVFKVSVFVTVVFIVPAVVIGSYLGGINGVALALFICKFFGLATIQRYIKRYLNITVWQMLNQVSKPFLVCSVLGIFLALFKSKFEADLNSWLLLFIGGFILVLVYGAYVYFVEKPLIENMIRTIKNRKK